MWRQTPKHYITARFLPGFHTLESTGSIEKLKGCHGREMRFTDTVTQCYDRSES